MAKVSRYLDEDKKEFNKTFKSLTGRKSSWQVWSDFVECSAISISNALDHESLDREQREKQYMDIIKSYSEDERHKLAELLGITANALEHDPKQDFLGEMFMSLGLNSHWHGQFFTPYHIAEFMSKITDDGAKENIAEHGWTSVTDCACGAGVMLIAARNTFLEHHIVYRQALFVAQDIDRTAGLMCYIQLSLLGCTGYVVIADSLTNPVASMADSPLLPIFNSNHDVWYTPMFYDEVWQDRIRIEELGVLLSQAFNTEDKPASQIETQPEPEYEENTMGQMMLF